MSYMKMAYFEYLFIGSSIKIRMIDIVYSVRDEEKMPKKPFTPLEIQNQRERIMDCASYVISKFGYHHLSMRNLAKQLNMTASNIYNYFSSKEILYLNTRRRGFELLFNHIKNQELKVDKNKGSLYDLSINFIDFGLDYPGYYQLIFRGPKLSFSIDQVEDVKLISEIDLLTKEWQDHLEKLIIDNIANYKMLPEINTSELCVFYISLVYGLIDNLQYSPLPILKNISRDVRKAMVRHLIDQVITSMRVETYLKLYSHVIDENKLIDLIKVEANAIV